MSCNPANNQIDVFFQPDVFSMADHAATRNHTMPGYPRKKENTMFAAALNYGS